MSGRGVGSKGDEMDLGIKGLVGLGRGGGDGMGEGWDGMGEGMDEGDCEIVMLMLFILVLTSHSSGPMRERLLMT
jgi:hypothetical protein